MKSEANQAREPASSAAASPSGAGPVAAISAWSLRHPVAALMLVSLLAIMVNCYPVIFCGRSFVSPVCAAPTIFGWWPSAPGLDSKVQLAERHESDTATMMVWDIPVSYVESRSLWEHGELPWWNRYSHAGDTLIGQAVSMLGDPLQLIVIVGHGSAVAHDIKFLAAKLLFCLGLGLVIARLLGSWTLALLYAVLAAYCGAFFYIDNHPVFFVFSYAPWILLSALAWLAPRTKRRAGWALLWLAANFSCFNAGHVEAAVDVIGGMNLAALVYIWIIGRSRTIRLQALGRMAVGTVLFLGLTAPVWLSFLAALPGSYSVHEKVQATQVPPGFLVGLFDDQFFLSMIGKRDISRVPGTSLLILTGCILSLLKWRQLIREPFFRVNVGALFLWGGAVFGWVPKFVLLAVPLLSRVGHTNTDFGYLLVIHLMIQSAYGFKCLALENSLARAAKDFLRVVLVFIALFSIFALGTRHQPVPGSYFLSAAAGAIGAPWLYLFLKLRHRDISWAGWCGILLLGFLPHFRFGLYTGGNDQLLMIPGPRVALTPPLPSLNQIHEDHSEAFRVVGLNGNFGGDYEAAYGLEDIRSCEALSDGRYIQLIQTFPGVNFGSGWVITIKDPGEAQPLLNFLNVKYLLADAQQNVAAHSQNFKRVFSGEPGHDFTVWENRTAWPRAFFASEIVPMTSDHQFLDFLLKNGDRPFVTVDQDEIVRHPALQSLMGTAQTTITAATNYVLLPNSTAFDIRVPSPGVVCLIEGQPQDFVATANGVSKPIFTVDHVFRGIYLDQPGDYHIEYRFRPPYWGKAVFLFWIALAVTLSLGAVGFWRDSIRHGSCGTEAQGSP